MTIRKELKFLIPKEQNPYYMNNPKLFDELFELVSRYPNHYHKKIMSRGAKKHAKDYRYLRSWIDSVFPLHGEYSYSTKCYWIFNGLTEVPRCRVCGSPIDVSGMRLRLSDEYPKTCGAKGCVYSLAMETMACTKTRLYGDPYYHNVEKQKATVASHAETDPEYWFRREQKSKATKIRRGHSRNWNNWEQARLTNAAEYGTSSFLGSEEFRTKHRTAERVHENVCKAISTRRKNGTFNTSRPELRIASMFKETFGEGDVLTNWNGDPRYPRMVDIYVRSLDMFVECNFFWCHGGKFFDETCQSDAEKLTRWKQLAEEKRQERPNRRNAYEIAIYTWTVSDRLKLKYAKGNRLNYLVFWTEQEAVEWLQQYKTGRNPSK